MKDSPGGSISPSDALQRGVRPETFALLVITLFGAALRIHRLDIAELWTDEITGVIWSDWNLRDCVNMIYTSDWIHFPLPTRVLWAFRAMFGEGETIYRLVGFIPGVLAIPALYLLGKELFSKELGLVAAVLLACSPTAVYISQEAWDYGLTLLFVPLTAWSFFRAWQLHRWRDWVLFGLIGLVCFYTHLLNAAVLASLYVVYGVFLFVPLKDRTAWNTSWKAVTKPIMIGVLVAGLCIVGAYPVLRTGGPGANPQAGLGAAGDPVTFGERFFTVMTQFAYDRPYSLYILAALAALGIPFLLERPRQWLFVMLAGLSLSGPVYLAVSADYIFRVRHKTFALPFVLMAMACGIVMLRRLLGRWIARWRGDEPPALWAGLALAAVIMAWPAAQALQQYYLIRAPQSALLAYRLNHLVEDRLVNPPTKIQLYSKSEIPEYREIAALLQRNMLPGDVLILDTAKDDTGRDIVFHLNRRFGHQLPTDKWGCPKSTNYDSEIVTVMLSHPPESFFQSIGESRLPVRGVRVFRVSQRYAIGETPNTTAFPYTLISVSTSNEAFTDKNALIEHLRAHAALSQASDLLEASRDKTSDGQPDEQTCRTALKIFKSSAATTGLGIRLLQQGNATEAEPLLAFSAELRHDDWYTWYLLGRARQALGRTAEAMATWQTAKAIADGQATADTPNDLRDLLVDLARLYEATGDLEHAHQAYDTLASSLNEAGYQLEAARTCMRDGRPDVALQESLPIVAGQPEWPLANFMVAWAYDALNRREEGYSYAVKAAALRPDDVAMVTLCARYHAWFHKYDQAEAVVLTALQHKPDDPSLIQWLQDLRAAAGSSQAR